MRPAGLFVVSIRKTGGPNSALQRSDAGGSIWASPLYTTKHLFCCMHFFYSNSWSVQVPVYAVRHAHAEVACPGLGWQFPPHSRGRLDVPATQPGQPFTFAAAPVCKQSGRRFCNRTRAKIPITNKSPCPMGTDFCCWFVVEMRGIEPLTS